VKNCILFLTLIKSAHFAEIALKMSIALTQYVILTNPKPG